MIECKMDKPLESIGLIFRLLHEDFGWVVGVDESLMAELPTPHITVHP